MKVPVNAVAKRCDVESLVSTGMAQKLGLVIAVPAWPERGENVISVERWSLGLRRARFNPSFLMDQRKVRCACGVKTDWLCVLFGWASDWHRLNRSDCVPWLECPTWSTNRNAAARHSALVGRRFWVPVPELPAL